MSDDNTIPVQYVRINDGADPNTLVLSPAEALGDLLHFDIKKMRGLRSQLRVGHVYTIPTTFKEEGRRTLAFGHASWVGPHPDSDLVVQWQAKQKAAELAQDAKRREAAEATGTSGLEEALAPVAKAYAALPYPHRAAFEVWVLSVLRRKG